MSPRICRLYRHGADEPAEHYNVDCVSRSEGLEKLPAAFDPLAAGPASTAAQLADPIAVQNRRDQKEAFQEVGTPETRKCRM